MKAFPLRVLAPERTFFDGACTSLTVPSIDGIYGLMAQHEDIVLAIVPGKLTLRDADGVEQIAAVSEGVLKMEHGEALVLVDTIERPGGDRPPPRRGNGPPRRAPSSRRSAARRSRPLPMPASPARSAAFTSSTTGNK